ncbi:GTP-binding protein Rho1 [Coemansia nantahalensis]|nr:GTP-binding protein Rho1 [Coemansia nantahalensis]
MVTYEEGVSVASKINAHKYMECSAKSGAGVRDVFEEATRAALTAAGKRKRKGICVVL